MLMTAVFYLLILAVLAGGGWFAWQQFGGGGVSLFGGARESRIGVSEIATIDGKRKLLLIHRDGVEHLIMTGGPIDVVIEQGILPQRRPLQAQAPHAAAAPAYEPRFAAPPTNLAAEAPGVDGPSTNFGRLRQRPAQPQPTTADPYPRGEGPGLASGNGNR